MLLECLLNDQRVVEGILLQVSYLSCGILSVSDTGHSCIYCCFHIFKYYFEFFENKNLCSSVVLCHYLNTKTFEYIFTTIFSNFSQPPIPNHLVQQHEKLRLPNEAEFQL